MKVIQISSKERHLNEKMAERFPKRLEKKNHEKKESAQKLISRKMMRRNMRWMR